MWFTIETLAHVHGEFLIASLMRGIIWIPLLAPLLATLAKHWTLLFNEKSQL